MGTWSESEATVSERTTWEFIRSRLRLASVSLVPEIAIHAAHPGSGLSRRPHGASEIPYWAYAWAGGIALARHLLDHPETAAGLRVLDAGTGSGLVAIAAALAGARHVTAIDVDADAAVAACINAGSNGVAVDVVHGDIATAALPPADLVLAGDLFYAEDAARAALLFLERRRAAGARVLVGDPGRKFLPRERLRLLASYPIPDFGSAAATASGNVYELG